MANVQSCKKRAMVILATCSMILGVLSTGWMAGCVNQWIFPWTTFKIFLPKDPAYMKNNH